MAEVAISPHEETPHLRRDVTVWGSFTWGYADVGADVYVALGLVVAAAQGLAPLAFAVAGMVYVLIGLAYTELAATYPVAGGGQYFALRGLGDFWGLVAGGALLLDYTIDIALFAYASAGYVNFFFPTVREFSVTIGPFHGVNPLWGLESLLIIVFLMFLNIKGIRESSLFNSVIGAIDMAIETSIITLGFVFAWDPNLLVKQWTTQAPSFERFLYAASLAIISYVGLESVSQSAQETKRPATVIPRTSIALIFTVLMFALAFPTVSLGILPWQEIAAREGDPVARLASSLPFVGFMAGPIAAILAATIILISANTGVMGASRLTYSMSELGLIGPWFRAVNPKFHTPVRTIVVFSGVAAVEATFAILSGRALDTLANMYAFGASLAYLISFISLVVLRFRDPYSPRPYRVPGNIRWRGHDVPILGFVGVLSITLMLATVVFTHPLGRILGPAWVVLVILYYWWYRWRAGKPLLGNLPRDWERAQMRILEEAEEFELLEEYRIALAYRDRERTKHR